MIPGFNLVQFAQTAGPLAVIVVVAAIIFSENGLLIGFFFPGDSVLFTVGFLIQGTTHFKLNLNIELIILLLFVAATLGANVGYLFGKKIGPTLFKRPNSLLFKQENVQKAQDFYDKHGGKTIILARFIPVVRTFVPLIAGIGKMRYKTFMIFNVIGGFIWVAGVTYLGFYLGKLLQGLGIDVDAVLLPIIALILLVSISPALYQLLKNKQQRQAIWSATKLEWVKIIERKK
ncbi:MAG TPA: VTT domain-containing protein [Candidatus Saccharimonadales bacterium]|nr:VTT domain-containing protein [Candidatus Saccharimonadales bacterium]